MQFHTSVQQVLTCQGGFCTLQFAFITKPPFLFSSASVLFLLAYRGRWGCGQGRKQSWYSNYLTYLTQHAHVLRRCPVITNANNPLRVSIISFPYHSTTAQGSRQPCFNPLITHTQTYTPAARTDLQACLRMTLRRRTHYVQLGTCTSAALHSYAQSASY